MTETITRQFARRKNSRGLVLIPPSARCWLYRCSLIAVGPYPRSNVGQASALSLCCLTKHSGLPLGLTVWASFECAQDQLPALWKAQALLAATIVNHDAGSEAGSRRREKGFCSDLTAVRMTQLSIPRWKTANGLRIRFSKFGVESITSEDGLIRLFSRFIERWSAQEVYGARTPRPQNKTGIPRARHFERTRCWSFRRQRQLVALIR